MFNYTHSVICNDAAALEQAVAHLVDANDAKLPIVKAAYKEVGSAGTAKSYPIAPPASLGKVTAPADGYRIYIKLVSPMRELVEFASPNWQEFSKGIMVEVSDITDPTKVENALTDAIKGLDTKPFEVAGLTITMCDPRVQAIVTVDAYGPDAKGNEVASPIGGASNNGVINDVIDAAAFPKFDYEWMCANVAFPTHLNMRYYAPNDMPVPGKVYDCYTVTLASKRPGLGGLSAVGQNVESKTKAVFYVQQGVTPGTKARAVFAGATGNHVITDATVAIADADDAAIDANS